MATEAVPMCSICVDVFRDPVTLPCQHDFCRPCLQMFAEKCKPTTVRDDVNNTDQEEAVTVTCPVCRSPANLGSAGVADLPTNITLVDLVRKFQAEDKTCEQDTPKCLVCEDNNSSPAVKYCRTCTVLYCQECFSVCHPMRGGLKRHDVIPVEEFLSLRATGGPGAGGKPGAMGEPGAPGKPGVMGMSWATGVPGAGGEPGVTGEPGTTAGDPGDSARPIPCDKHSQPLSIFCATCEEVICVGCLEGHTYHMMQSIKSACDKLKAPLEEKTVKYTELKDQIDKLRTEMDALFQDIQDNEDAHRDDIERAYTTATEVLNCWRREALEVVEKRHSDWRREWKAAMKDLDMKAGEIERMIETSKDLISSIDILFLQGSKKLKERLEDQLPDMKTSTKRQEEIKTKMRESVRRDLVIPRRLSLKESILSSMSRPVMKFSQTNHKDLEITDGGSMVQFVGGYGSMVQFVGGYGSMVQFVGGYGSMVQFVGGYGSMVQFVGGYGSMVQFVGGYGSMVQFVGGYGSMVQFVGGYGSMVQFVGGYGSMVQFVGWGGTRQYEAWTDVPLPPGDSYWELEITIQPHTWTEQHQCAVGIKHQGYSLCSADCGTSCWDLILSYHRTEFWCSSSCGDVKPAYKQWRPHTGRYRLGLYLDTEKQTLIIVDCRLNHVMFTSNSIDVSKPLFHAVYFDDLYSPSARLVTGDNCILPQVIQEIWCKTA